MRNLGEQWIEEDRHMYKAISKYEKKDLGPVNEDGCLAEERTGLFPRVAYVEKDTWVAEFHNSSIDVACYGKTEEDCIELGLEVHPDWMEER